MRKALLVLAILLVGGCVADKAPSPDASEGGKPSRARNDDDDSGKHKQFCVDTVEGAESKQICY